MQASSKQSQNYTNVNKVYYNLMPINVKVCDNDHHQQPAVQTSFDLLKALIMQGYDLQGVQHGKKRKSCKRLGND